MLVLIGKDQLRLPYLSVFFDDSLNKSFMLLFVENYLLIELRLIFLDSFVDEQICIFCFKVVLRWPASKCLFWKSFKVKRYDIFIIKLEPVAVMVVNERVVMPTIS
jgi:hypothetical protein